MWSPTHVQLTVQKAKGLITKGKNGTNDAFVTIALGKDKYQTSLKAKASEIIEWHEKCDLQIPKQGNTAEITLTVFHRNFLGVDEFLGCVSIPLADFDVYEMPRNKWYKLKDKPGKDKKKERGELEVKVAFVVMSGSLADLTKKDKHKSSVGQLSQVFSGSLISISSLDKRKGLKKLASKIGKKVKSPKHNDADGLDEISIGTGMSRQVPGDADPGVISEGEGESEDEFTDEEQQQGQDEHIKFTAGGDEIEIDDLCNTDLAKCVNFEKVEKSGKCHTLEFPGSQGVVTKHWMKAYRKIKIGHASIKLLDELSHKGSGCSLEVTANDNIASASSANASLENLAGGEILRRSSPPAKPPRFQPNKDGKEKKLDEWEQKLYGKHGKEGGSGGGRKVDTLKRRLSVLSLFSMNNEENAKTPSPSSSCKDLDEDTRSTFSPSAFNRSTMERIIIGGETEKPVASNSSRLSQEVLKNYEGKSREDLIEMVMRLEADLKNKRAQQKDLEDYLDNLLLRVMETSPRILQNPYINCKAQAKIM
ncbi:rab11 family-interacting protein 1 isoform X2 [Nilaparvata lugens]|uniref:rab11 family-interacting protein 1 isoform X2 n=1 Tax=Nilaparvata lugens TaxID=108931 RepID=UPI00193DAC9F|nr:rab11 family-interacting protein 1 isoform X2 [Nilaparvata lugens]